MEEKIENEQKDHTKIWQIILIGIIAIFFTAVWLSIYEYGNELIWMNDIVKTNRWIILVLPIFFAFFVGICSRFLKAPNAIEGGIAESMRGDESHADYKKFPGTLLSSFFSLWSGASIGPEGPLAFLIIEISTFFREKLHIDKKHSIGVDVAALASSYNAIIGNPLFTAILATEFNIGKKDAFTFLAWNLLAGVIGYLIYTLLGFHSFATLLTIPTIDEINCLYFSIAIVLGIFGAFIAITIGLIMKIIGSIMDKVFKNNIMARLLFAGLITGIVCFLIPNLLFSGEPEIQSIIDNPAEFGILMLCIMAVLKVILLGISLKGGFLGGPVFPILFTCTLIGLILSLLFPSVPVGIFIMCLEAAVITLALGAPLTAILLIAVLGTGNQYSMGLLVLSSVVAMIMGMILKEVQENQKSNKPRQIKS